MLQRIAGWQRVVLIVALMVVSGCASSEDSAATDDGSDRVVVLAKAEGWRDGLADATGHGHALIEIVDPDGTQQAWDDNVPTSLPMADGDPAEPGVYRSLEDVDLDRHVVVVYSSGQSSSCPGWVEDLTFTEGRLEVALATAAEPEQPCTDDFAPYRLVLAVDIDALPSSDELPVDRIDIPSDNLVDVAGQVVAYPADGDAG